MAQQPTADDEPTALIDRITNAGPDDGRTIITRKQAAALVYRDLCGYTRKEAAEQLDVSVYTVDDRLREARTNTAAVAAVASVLADLDAYHSDADTDALAAAVNRLTDTDDDTDDSEAAETADVTSTADSPADDTDDTDDDEAAIWGRLMAMDSVVKVERRNSVHGPTVQINATDADRDRITGLMGRLGWVNTKYVPEFGGQDADVYFFNRPEDVDTDDTDDGLDADDADDSEAAEPASSSSEPSGSDTETPEPRDMPDYLIPAAIETDADLGKLPDDTDDDTDDIAADETADVGRTDDVSVLDGVGPQRAENLRSRGFETVGDVADADASDLKESGLIGDVTAERMKEQAEKAGESDQ